MQNWENNAENVTRLNGDNVSLVFLCETINEIQKLAKLLNEICKNLREQRLTLLSLTNVVPVDAVYLTIFGMIVLKRSHSLYQIMAIANFHPSAGPG